MTREEAIRLLQATRLMLMDGANQPISDLYYALDMAIEALERIEPETMYYPQVDGITPSVIEPQTYITEDRDTQILDAWQVHCGNTTTVEDEPQLEQVRCGHYTCHNYEACKKNGWQGCVYEPKTEPQTKVSYTKEISTTAEPYSKTVTGTHDLDDVGRQIQSAYDKGAISDASAIQAWYTAVNKTEPLTCRNKEFYETCEYSDNCNPTVCFKAFDEFSRMLDEATGADELQTERSK